jgi:hypothetical protein
MECELVCLQAHFGISPSKVVLASTHALDQLTSTTFPLRRQTRSAISQISLVQRVATVASTEPVLSFGYGSLFTDLVPQSWALAVNSSRHPRVVRPLIGRMRAHFKAAFLCSATDHRPALLSCVKCKADKTVADDRRTDETFRLGCSHQLPSR